MEEFSVSIWHQTSRGSGNLAGIEGELISVRIATNPRALEDLLECLATLSFPINPQIVHGVPTTVEFPAWESKLDEIRAALYGAGFDTECMDVRGMLATIAGH